MSQLKLGIVGAGMIAGVIARAVANVEEIELVGITSRTKDSAVEFAKQYQVHQIFESWKQMIASEEIDAIYIATPTSVKEEIAIAAANKGKHILVDKPFDSYPSLERIITAAKAQGVAFMDATHFSHHPRTQSIRDSLESSVGRVQSVQSSFFFPFMDRSNIRFDKTKEPTGALGDMAWYSMRAITEYLQPTAKPSKVLGHVTKDPETGAIIHGTGAIVFEDGKSSNFDFGYNAGVCLMDLNIIGTQGSLSMDDYILDWKSGFAFQNERHVVGYTKRIDMQTPDQWEFVPADSAIPQTWLMMRNFAKLASDPASDLGQRATNIALQTQFLLDLYWESCQ